MDNLRFANIDNWLEMSINRVEDKYNVDFDGFQDGIFRDLL